MTALTSSVLMSVYCKVPAEQLRQCLASLVTQTRQPDQIVIVIDGAISADLQALLDQYQNFQPDQVTLVPLDENGGLINALNTGLTHCIGDWILRMDADDLAMPNRFNIQLGLVAEEPEIDVLGCSMLEFDTDPRLPARFKPVIEAHDAIARALPFRNPINHPTACIRKSRLLEIGGYPDLALLEDYFLWAKLLKVGAKFRNLSEPLYLFRFDDQTLQRRAGSENFKNEVWLRHWMYQAGLSSLPILGLVTALQIVLRFSPLGVRRWLWHRSREDSKLIVDLPADI
ncbi:MAG: glycosyltransferase involved in cell wall biosynthesis [Candidatus Azotimanducaceae bacterium]|jgi:glycosyltransferase involved in cell wall biosynthesis